MTRSLDDLTALSRYTRAAELSADRIIRAYSTSFNAATMLLGRRHRSHVRNIYALVRVADELVDGVAAEALLSPEQQRIALDGLEDETIRALASGYSSNPIVHAFAHTARASGIDEGLIRPFFSSMRSDLASAIAVMSLDDDAHSDYVYGSAEAVGLMCLRVFLRTETRTPENFLLEHGARRLGAAFQNVNFLRDLSDDTNRLGRHYLSDRGLVDTRDRDRWLRIIREQLADARAALPHLPRDARLGVDAALRLFERLADRIARTAASELYQRRARITTPEKSVVLARAIAGHARRGRP